MIHRTLGRTGLKVSEIGLGTEYLNNQSPETVYSVINKAFKNGINYFDIVFTFKDYLNNLSKAFSGIRDKIIITGHLGSSEKSGKYSKIRNINNCKEKFEELLLELGTNYVDIIFLQFITLDEYETIISPGNLLDLAISLREQGKAKYIGLSTHNVSVGIKTANNPSIDVLMFPINLALHAMEDRNRLFLECEKNKKGLVAMKPFAGGRLLLKKDFFIIPAYQTGNKKIIRKEKGPLSPVKCINYTLSQQGVSTVVPGVKDIKELKATLEYLNANNEKKDFSSVIINFKEYRQGECVYCNHCLPCPSEINIGELNRYIDLLEMSNKKNKDFHLKYLEQAKRCIECNNCTKRCPFGVDVVSKFQKFIISFNL